MNMKYLQELRGNSRVRLQPSQLYDSPALLEVDNDICRWHFALRLHVERASARRRGGLDDGRGGLKKTGNCFVLSMIVLLGHDGFIPVINVTIFHDGMTFWRTG
jgi:hypothetical protein